MLSIIVYGRNDSHGYNLARRAVLSLNCLAELLDADGDEILFVDYNTPDDLPSFIEANRDALTDRARRTLRVLRVRPDQHARFAERTHLPVLEAIARNVALRRSNPANRWILSTNSDIIASPLNGRSLSALTADLADGFYHAPRFELPQIIWESLNRADPAAAIARISDLGARLHLNEIVRTLPSHGVDSPGDFQLVLRKDIFELRGFDEEMLLGWHLDANLARRLSFRYGPARLVDDRLAVYHCDHTRQATLTHGAGHLENDWRRFVEDVAMENADLPEQRDVWGLAGEEVEEIRIDQDPAARYFAALSALPPPGPHEYLKTAETFNDLRYAPEHVLPYLLDLLSALPRRWSLGYYGCRPRMEAMLRDGWRALGFTGDILNSADAIERADIFIFEFGLASSDDPTGRGADAEICDDGRRWSDADMDKLWAARQSFEAVAAAERRRPRPLRRRIVLLNAIHNIFEAQVAADIAAVHTPFSPRLRQGFVRDELASHRPPPAGWSAADWNAADGDPNRSSPAARRPSETALSRLPSPADWSDPEWSAALRRGLGRDALDTAPRNLWYWERGAILHALASSGVLRDDAEILVVAVTPEPLYAALTGLVGRIVVADWRAEPTDDPAWRRPLSLLQPGRLTFCDGEPDADARFDAVVLPHNVALKDGAAGMIHVLNGLRNRLKPTGVLVFSADVRLPRASGGDVAEKDAAAFLPWLESERLSGGSLATVLSALCDLLLCAPSTLTLPNAAAVDDETADGALIVQRPEGAFTRFVGTLRPDPAAVPARPEESLKLATALGGPVVGPQLSRLALGPGVRREADGTAVVPRDCSARLALFGPYLILPPGDYRLTAVAQTDGDAPDATALEVRILRGDGLVLAQRALSVGFLQRSPAAIRFRVPPATPGRAMPTVEFQFAHFNAADIHVILVDLEDAAAPSPRLWREGWIDPLLGSLMPRLCAADQGVSAGIIEIPPGPAPEDVLWGPYLGLPTGEYRLTFQADPPLDAPPDQLVCEVKIVATSTDDGGDLTLARIPMTAARLRQGAASCGFSMPEWCAVDGPEPRTVEVRLVRSAPASLTVRAVDLARETADGDGQDKQQRFELLLGPLLPRLLRTPTARNGDDGAVIADPDDAPGCLLYGPYLRLPAGRYDVRVTARCGAPRNPAKAMIGVDVTAGDRVLASCRFDAADFLGGEASAVFDLPPELSIDAPVDKSVDPPMIETRISHFANAIVEISAVNLQMAN